MNLWTKIKSFLADRRGSVQPEVVALTVSALLLGLTYVESVKRAAEDPPVREEVYERRCASTLQSGDAGSSVLATRKNCD